MTDKEILEKRELLRLDEAADILRVSKRTIYRRCASGELDSARSCGSLRVKTACIREIIEGEE